MRSNKIDSPFLLEQRILDFQMKIRNVNFKFRNLLSLFRNIYFELNASDDFSESLVEKI